MLELGAHPLMVAPELSIERELSLEVTVGESGVGAHESNPYTMRMLSSVMMSGMICRR